jgi:mycothiol synthase
MSALTAIKPTIHIPWSNQFPQMRFRNFEGPADYPGIVQVIQKCMQADEIKNVITVQDLETFFKHLNHCDPYQDLLLVENKKDLLAYLRMDWQEQTSGERIYRWILNVAPEARGNGLENRLLQYAETHLGKIAKDHPNGAGKFFEMGLDEKEIDKKSLLEGAEYKPNRYFFEMSRDLKEPLPDAPMVDGVEVRPAAPDHYRSIWNALGDAFQDHWGHREHTEKDYQGWLSNRWFQPHHWKVAWAGDEVVGTVLGFIDEVENESFDRNRGYTEDICVRRPWRRQGIARSLLVQSMQEFRDMGMEETALGVDTQNPNGALRLYLGVGYHRERCHIVYRKPLIP